MQCEVDKKGTEYDDEDPFIYEGLSSSSDSDNVHIPSVRQPAQHQSHTAGLAAGKVHRKELKNALLRHQNMT